MKWRRVKNKDVIDIRGASKGSSGGGLGGLGGGGGSRLPIPTSMAGLGGGAGLIAVVVVLAIQLIGGGSGFSLDNALGPSATAPGANKPAPIPADEDPDRDLKDFSTYVFTDAQQMWEGAFERAGSDYERAQLVLYSDAVSTGGCGSASSAVGPFYCPADERVYLDLSFYAAMERQLGASGDFAWAYVIAHEMGHHIQRVTGTSDSVRSRSAANPDDANELSVRQELQADCYAGVWAATVFEAGDLEEGDLEEAFQASEAVGDDRIQSRGGGSINPDSFTHGTSEQRRRWFTTGYESADASSCDTFSVGEV